MTANIAAPFKNVIEKNTVSDKGLAFIQVKVAGFIH